MGLVNLLKLVMERESLRAIVGIILVVGSAVFLGGMLRHDRHTRERAVLTLEPSIVLDLAGFEGEVLPADRVFLSGGFAIERSFEEAMDWENSVLEFGGSSYQFQFTVWRSSPTIEGAFEYATRTVSRSESVDGGFLFESFRYDQDAEAILANFKAGGMNTRRFFFAILPGFLILLGCGVLCFTSLTDAQTTTE